MTRLSKPVRRVTDWRAPHGVAALVSVTLYPGGVMGLREHRRRKEVRLDIATLYAQALLKEEREKKRLRRRGGRGR